jgi:putative zinc finger/helix-turn-helix YgiT family protein
MRCVSCGAETKTRTGTHPYTESGLSNVRLEGIEISTCTRCGEKAVAIPRIDELHKVISYGLATWPGRLDPRQIRFLRKHLGWSSKRFASEMGVAPETVSRWEHGTARMELPTERLLRLFVLCQHPARRYAVETLEDFGRPDAKPAARTRFSAVMREAGGWRFESAGSKPAAR